MMMMMMMAMSKRVDGPWIPMYPFRVSIPPFHILFKITCRFLNRNPHKKEVKIPSHKCKDPIERPGSVPVIKRQRNPSFNWIFWVLINTIPKGQRPIKRKRKNRKKRKTQLYSTWTLRWKSCTWVLLNFGKIPKFVSCSEQLEGGTFLALNRNGKAREE